MYFYRLPITVSDMHRFVRKEKVIPHRTLGVVALPPTSRIMQSILEWIKNERLHKYWPIFSRMNYQTIVGLKEDNFMQALANIDAEEMTHGARGRILRCAEWLRARPATLDSINEETPLEEVCQIFSNVLETPLSAADEPYGISLIQKLCQKLRFVILTHGMTVIRFPGFEEVLIAFANKEDIPEREREFARRTIRNMSVIWDLVTPPPSRSPTPPWNTSSCSIQSQVTSTSSQRAMLPNGRSGQAQPDVAATSSSSSGTTVSRNVWFTTPEQRPGVQAGTSAAAGFSQRQHQNVSKPVQQQNGISPRSSYANTQGSQNLNGHASSVSNGSASHSTRSAEQSYRPCRQLPDQPARPLPAQTFRTYRPASQPVRPMQVLGTSSLSARSNPYLMQPSTTWATWATPQIHTSCSYIPLSTVVPSLPTPRAQPVVNDLTRMQPPTTRPTRMQPPATRPTRMQPPVTEPPRMRPPVTEPTRMQPPMAVPAVSKSSTEPSNKPSTTGLQRSVSTQPNPSGTAGSTEPPNALASTKDPIPSSEARRPWYENPDVDPVIDEHGEPCPKPSTWPPPPWTGEPWIPASPPAPGIHQLYQIHPVGWFQPTRQPMEPPVDAGAWPETPVGAGARPCPEPPANPSAWPETPEEKRRAFQSIEDSYTLASLFENVDQNATWGGQENQVLLDLNNPPK